MTRAARNEQSKAKPEAKPPVRGSGPVEGVRGNREVPPAGAADPTTTDPGAADPATADAETTDPPDARGGLDARLAEAEAKRDEYLDLAQRVQADFDNYRKRALRDQERLVAHAHERLVRELLPILDDLERALQAAERHEEAALVDGVRLVESSLRNALAKEGLVEIETNGVFDPHVHEALLTQSREGAESGSVVEVVQRGYRLGDRVVRPAKVIVAA